MTELAISVVVADDDQGFVDALRVVMAQQSRLVVVGTAADGLEALDLVDDLHPDAVVLDLHMPLLDGVSAAARLRRDHPDLCLIALTGDEKPAVHRAAREAGCDAVLVKEDFFAGLVDRLTDRLARARRTDQARDD